VLQIAIRRALDMEADLEGNPVAMALSHRTAGSPG